MNSGHRDPKNQGQHNDQDDNGPTVFGLEGIAASLKRPPEAELQELGDFYQLSTGPWVDFQDALMFYKTLSELLLELTGRSWNGGQRGSAEPS